MITSIDIENLRGIAHGRLEGLAPLTILTGVNASGKSTVLDALLIGASPSPEDAVGRAVARHPASLSGSKWLFGQSSAVAKVNVSTASGEHWERELTWYGHCSQRLEDQLLSRRGSKPFSMIHLREDLYADHAASTWTGFSTDNLYVGQRGEALGLSTVPFVRLIDPGIPIPLQRSFSAVRLTDRDVTARRALVDLIPDFESMEILVEEDETPILHMKSQGVAVPLPLAGDGIQALVQLVLETALVDKGLALIEEPEVYQHPRAIGQTAKVLIDTMRRGVQIVLTTHSLELIDSLLMEAKDEEIDSLALFNMKLERGQLVSARWSGSEIIFARQQIETDLR